MLTLSDDIDLVIPRGGERLIRFVHEHSRIPTVQHFEGVCHIFVDESADLDEAVEIVATAKTSNPATCNTVECVLVHSAIAEKFVPALAQKCAGMGVEMRGDERFCASAGEAGGDHVKPASPDDFGKEFLDLILAARVVDSIDEAIAHIGEHASDHTESILTKNDANAERFRREVTSSCVMVNASTRFNDGFRGSGRRSGSRRARSTGTARWGSRGSRPSGSW